MRFFENALAWQHNNSRALEKYGVPVHAIADQRKDLGEEEHDSLVGFVLDKQVSEKVLVVFDDEHIVSVRKLRSEVNAFMRSCRTPNH